ncbi:hypothetical protein SDC9_104942 [bioreactor metagenome]|uniref:Uncharacterized protein n=1 Tax=bioreactor metagenome TaxID=1076179 RepID=A0A645B4L9_9ZZZZ
MTLRSALEVGVNPDLCFILSLGKELVQVVDVQILNDCTYEECIGRTLAAQSYQLVIELGKFGILKNTGRCTLCRVLKIPGIQQCAHRIHVLLLCFGDIEERPDTPLLIEGKVDITGKLLFFPHIGESVLAMGGDHGLSHHHVLLLLKRLCDKGEAAQHDKNKGYDNCFMHS